jgi:hypothetical protein
LREHIRGSASKFQRRHRLDVGDAAHAVCAKNFLLLGHGVIETLESQFVNGKISLNRLLQPRARTGAGLYVAKPGVSEVSTLGCNAG